VPARSLFTVAAAVWMLLVAGLHADDPRIAIGIAGSERMRDDLKYLMELAPAPLPKQWRNLEDMLLSFEQGIQEKQPIRLDLVFSGQGLKYEPAFPIEKLEGRNGFIENLQSFGFVVGKPNAAGIYEIKQPPPGGGAKKVAAGPAAKPFYMRHLKAGMGYAVIASDVAKLPAALPDPGPPLQQWLPVPVDVAVRIDNDAAGLASRKASFSQMRKELEAAVQFKRTDTPEQIELKKLSLQQNLNEAERFLVETEKLDVTWVTDATAQSARGEMTLTGLPDTSLLTSIQMLALQPSYFANVKFHPQPALQLRINFPVDDLRSGHAKELYPALLPVMQADMDSRPALNAAGKAAAKQALDILFTMLNDGLPLRVLDGFIDAHATGDGKHVVLCGIRAADGTKATAALELFPQIRDGWKLQQALAEHEGVTIHALTVAPHRLEEFRALCAGEPVVYVGVSKDAVWGAAGEGSLDKLKAAITETGQPAPDKADPVFLSLQMRFAPWVQVLDILRSREAKPAANDRTAQEEEKRRTRLRKISQDAFAPADDRLEVTLRREEDRVIGQLEAHLGIQRFIGSVMAFVTEEYLQ
jgi:hypothetical protein